jgi:hypothetical protein
MIWDMGWRDPATFIYESAMQTVAQSILRMSATDVTLQLWREEEGGSEEGGRDRMKQK